MQCTCMSHSKKCLLFSICVLHMDMVLLDGRNVLLSMKSHFDGSLVLGVVVLAHNAYTKEGPHSITGVHV